MKYNSITSITEGEQDPYLFSKKRGIHEASVLETPEGDDFLGLLKCFSEWLRLLNFEPTTRRDAPVKIQEFLAWLSAKGVHRVTSITREMVTEYVTYLAQRKNKRNPGRLSKNTLRTHVTNLRRFARYLRESEGETFEVSVHIKGNQSQVKDIFTQLEIKALYEASGSDLLGLRDRAMLSIYYGCGLRRSEGVSLDVNDILMQRSLLHVRKGKNFKERYVPMTEVVREDVSNYIEGVRPILLKHPTQALFLNHSGNRLKGQSMMDRLNHLKEKAGITKEAGLHSLRHSIATHLLQSGMELERIKQFLGHSSLESTQIYTHILHE